MERKDDPAATALTALTERVERLEEAAREAIILIDEINKRAESRQFHGINQPLHAKLCTIRATIMRAALKGSSHG